jgi:methionyl-tRNA formyltransferase
VTLAVAVIGCVDSTKVALEALLARPDIKVTCLVTRRSSSFNSDFVDLTPLALAHGVKVLFADETTDDDTQAAWLKAQAPDVIFCVGWSRLLGNRVLGVAPRGVVGFHPAALPANRGRHPLVWALVLGLPETASSFFLMDAGADSGPLLHQMPVTIEVDDDATTLYRKILEIMPRQINEIVAGLSDGSLVPRPQDSTKANYWRKRTAADGRIDWRMDARGVFNLVRALTRPYPGAHFDFRGQAVKVWRCQVMLDVPRNLEPGKVVAVDERHVVVKCGHGAVTLIDHELTDLPTIGDYL